VGLCWTAYVSGLPFFRHTFLVRAFLVVVALAGCDLTQGRATVSVQVEMPSLAALTASDRSLLEQHFSGSLAWHVFDERGRRYAVRRQKIGAEYRTGSNGFISDFSSKEVVQTRVLIGLDGEYGFGHDQSRWTRATARGGRTPVFTFKDGDQPGRESYLIVTGGNGITVEVFEQSHLEERRFTAAALAEVEAELAQIRARGALATVVAGSMRPPGPVEFSVDDGMQPGMFGVRGWLPANAPGEAFVRVFYTGKPEAGDKIPPELAGKGETDLTGERGTAAARIGWSSDGSRFHYAGGLMIKTGDWEHHYPARFELWFRPDSGAPRKLASVERRIAGWQR
jgi:hypothetical protein